MLENHVDLTVLSTLRDVMETEYPALLHIFIRDSEARVTDLNGLIQAPDFSPASPTQLQQLGMMAHSFKGSSSNMGAVRLADLCHELEHRAKEYPPSDLQKLIREIDLEFAVVRPLYEAERERSLFEKDTVRRF